MNSQDPGHSSNFNKIYRFSDKNSNYIYIKIPLIKSKSPRCVHVFIEFYIVSLV
ncbi:hypothetical protein HZS_3655 [Henneguya salminicola]|nr:hypothetical protein HZS_3655 [Henneguya salminicola]